MKGESYNGDQHEIIQDLRQDEKITAAEATSFAGVGVFQVKLVILCGFVWIARGFEMVVVKAVNPLLSCTWALKRWQGALLSTVMFIATTFGCFLYGIWSDKYGRRTALSSSLIFLFVFGAVSAGLPNFIWFTVFRAIAGFAVGGFVQTLVLCCEFFPSSNRGRGIYVLSCFYALGVVIMLWVLYGTMHSEDGWRLFVAIAALPAFISMCLMRFFPESFRFLMVSDKYLAANDIKDEMIETNGKKLTAQLLHLSPKRPRRIVLDFFKMPFVRSSILLWLFGFVTSISFLGLVDLTPHLVKKGTNVQQPITNVTSIDFMGPQYDEIRCMKGVSQADFVLMVWTTALDFPSFVIYMILVDLINRKILLCASYVLSSFFTFLLFVPSTENILYIIFVYCARTLLRGQFVLILLMVAETFPTSHRGTAVGFEVATFYLGQFLSPYITRGLLSQKMMYCLILYGVLTFICSCASWGLKHETRHKELEDIIEEPSEENLPDNDIEVEEDKGGPRTTRLLLP